MPFSLYISPLISPYCALIEVAGVEEQEVFLVRHLRSQIPKLVVHPGDAADALFMGVRWSFSSCRIKYLVFWSAPDVVLEGCVNRARIDKGSPDFCLRYLSLILFSLTIEGKCFRSPKTCSKLIASPLPCQPRRALGCILRWSRSSRQSGRGCRSHEQCPVEDGGSATVGEWYLTLFLLFEMTAACHGAVNYKS